MDIPTEKMDRQENARALCPVSLETWIKSTRHLLALEEQEEIQTMRDKLLTWADRENPNVLSRLTLSRSSTGLFGRTVLEFTFPSLSLAHPKPHHFTVGDLVQLRVQNQPSLGTGIISRVNDHRISVATDSDPDELYEEKLSKAVAGVTLARLVNKATFLKLTRVLDQLASLDFSVAQNVVNVVFYHQKPHWSTPRPQILLFHPKLDISQVEAIQFALTSTDVAVIHGPPGTGKTTTIVELILQAVTRSQLKVLVCAPSNIAVDNVLDKVAHTCATVGKKLRLTRLGHPARVLPQILKYCLEAQVQTADGTEIVNDIRKEMTGMQMQVQNSREKSVRCHLRREIKANRKELRVREQKIVDEIVQHSQVVFATNVGAASKLLKDVTFDVVIIDEAAQALEASCWIPILKAKRCVLAGDHLQLPPTIKSKTAAAKGLDVTLFDRMTSFPSTQSIVKMLTTQYRMHEDISEWSSQAMYKGELKSFEGVAKRRLHELPHVNITIDDELLDATLLLLDTAGCGLEEDASDDKDKENSVLRLSKSNKGEARIVAKHVRALLEAGLKEDEVAVISPYNKQVQTLKALLLESYPKLEIRSVDGFQGCEKEAIVMSLVRSNASRQVGFLSDDRRMNVAITRAKRHVAVVCDTDTISSHKFLAGLVNHIEKLGEYRSAQEYLEEDAVEGGVNEQLMLSLSGAMTESVPSSTSASGFSTKFAANANRAKATKPKQIQKPKKAVKADRVPKPKPAETTQAESESQLVPTKTKAATGSEDIDDNEENESEEELEEKAVATRSIFQMLESESDSSDDEQKANNGQKEDVGEGKVRQELTKISISEANPDIKNANSLLKDLHLSRLTRQPSSSGKKSKNKKKKGGAKAANTVLIDELKENEDELEFLTRQASKSLSCALQGSSHCNKRITMLGSVCKFCKLKFCFGHVLPEVHGCGDAVRKFERTTFQQQPTQSTHPKKLTSDKRRMLKKKLEEQVSAKTASRTTEPKSKKK